MKSFKNKLISYSIKYSVCLIIIFIPIASYADAGVPIIFLSYPLMIIALLPIIIIESYVFLKNIKTSFKESILSIVVGNIVSALVGLPLAWGMLLILEKITTDFACGPGFNTIKDSIITTIIESAWICPWDDQLYWLIPTAVIINLIIAFFISIFIEFYIGRLFLKKLNKKLLWKATLLSNISSYIMVIVFCIGYLIYSIIKK